MRKTRLETLFLPLNDPESTVFIFGDLILTVVAQRPLGFESSSGSYVVPESVQNCWNSALGKEMKSWVFTRFKSGRETFTTR